MVSINRGVAFHDMATVSVGELGPRDQYDGRRGVSGICGAAEFRMRSGAGACELDQEDAAPKVGGREGSFVPSPFVALSRLSGGLPGLRRGRNSLSIYRTVKAQSFVWRLSPGFSACSGSRCSVAGLEIRGVLSPLYSV